MSYAIILSDILRDGPGRVLQANRDLSYLDDRGKNFRLKIIYYRHCPRPRYVR